jgi:hypothetical protein
VAALLFDAVFLHDAPDLVSDNFPALRRGQDSIDSDVIGMVGEGILKIKEMAVHGAFFTFLLHERPQLLDASVASESGKLGTVKVDDVLDGSVSRDLVQEVREQVHDVIDYSVDGGVRVSDGVHGASVHNQDFELGRACILLTVTVLGHDLVHSLFGHQSVWGKARDEVFVVGPDGTLGPGIVSDQRMLVSGYRDPIVADPQDLASLYLPVRAAGTGTAVSGRARRPAHRGIPRASASLSLVTTRPAGIGTAASAPAYGLVHRAIPRVARVCRLAHRGIPRASTPLTLAVAQVNYLAATTAEERGENNGHPENTNFSCGSSHPVMLPSLR